jgi:hypothetical protein
MSTEPGPILDVDQIVADLQDRVAARQAAGGYDPGVLGRRFELVEGQVVLRPELAYSAKPVVGAPITALKRVLIRLQIHFLNDVVAQVNSVLAADRAKLHAEVQRRTALEERVEKLEQQLTQTRSDSAEEPSTVGA